MTEPGPASLAEQAQRTYKMRQYERTAGIKLKRGRVSESAYEMMDALKTKANPSFFERIPRFLLHFRPW